MDRKIGFIGCGNMASAMIGGILKKGLVQPEDLTASDVSDAARQKAEENFGAEYAEFRPVAQSPALAAGVNDHVPVQQRDDLPRRDADRLLGVLRLLQKLVGIQQDLGAKRLPCRVASVLLDPVRERTGD